MHRYKTVARISLILSILNLVLAAPVVVQEVHEARGGSDDSKIFGMAATSSSATKSGELEAASDRATSPPSSLDAMALSGHSSLSDGTISSGYSADLSSDLSVSGYSWMLSRPPRPSLSPHLPASSHESASHASGPSEIPIPGLLHHGLEPPSPSSSGSWESQSIPAWLEELERVLAQNMNLDRASTGTHSPSEKFTASRQPSSASSATIPSTQYTSASAGSLSSHYFSASDGLEASLNPISEGSPSLPPENAKFLTENMVKKLKIVGGLTIIGAIVTGIAVPLIKNRDHQDS